MKPLLTAAILTVATLVFGVTLVWTCYKSVSYPPSFRIPSTAQSFAFSAPVSIQPDESQMLHLKPGLHQTNSPSPDLLPKNRNFVLSKPVPLHLDKLSRPPTQLQPGVYQTHPYAMILIVPGRGIDDGILGRKPDTYSKMPRIKPHVDVIPKAFQP